jgi:Tol biopolymer transport system component
MRNNRLCIALSSLVSGMAMSFGVAVVPATSALAASNEGCPNEQVRAESNNNPATAQPYSVGLPECRAYEMVTPLEKQQHDALTITGPPRIAVAKSGNAVEWASQGAYAGAESYEVHASHPTNPYVAHRTSSGWVTTSSYPPNDLIELPEFAFGGAGVYSPELDAEAVCGTVTATSGQLGPSIRCARQDGGSWQSTPIYTDLVAESFLESETIGASANDEDVVFYGSRGIPFLASDTSTPNCTSANGHCGGIYEETHIGGSPELQLVNVGNDGEMLSPQSENAIGAVHNEPAGSDYQAISTDGARVFFTAGSIEEVPTIYARVNGSETVTVSASECEGTCEHEESQRAVYQGASADGEKVFFTTAQELLPSDTDEEGDLYEYEFNGSPGHRLTQVSGGGLGDVTPGAGADVLGVVSVSENGSYVYFVAQGVLTTLPNVLGQSATSGAHNLYAYDTDNGETKFVTKVAVNDQQLWGVSESIAGTSGAGDVRLAQTTPDGEYLVFDSYAMLLASGPEADANDTDAQQVYRYDFHTGELLRISLGHEGYADNGNSPGFSAVIAPADDATEAASPTVNESNRSISEDGRVVAFISAAPLQSTDIASGANKSCDLAAIDADGAGCEVYVWHECTMTCSDGSAGAVSMISDGQDPSGAVYAGMSSTGADIFFQTRTQLVGQDPDSLGDIYDARIDGGFPAPRPEPACLGEGCQGTPSSAPVFSAPGTAGFSGGVNDVVPPSAVEPETKPKSKPLTTAQKLALALKSCKKEKTRRSKCEAAARKTYRSKKEAKTEKGKKARGK